MKYNLKELATKRYIVHRPDSNTYIPDKGYVIVYDDDKFCQYFTLDVPTGKWSVEEFDSREAGRVRDSEKEFEVFKQV